MRQTAVCTVSCVKQPAFTAETIRRCAEHCVAFAHSREAAPRCAGGPAAGLLPASRVGSDSVSAKKRLSYI